MVDKNEVEIGATAEHVDEKIDDDLIADTKHMIADAAAGFANEKELGALAAVKAYPYAILWSLVMAFCVVMEGYDCALIGSFFAFPSFQIKFGRYVGVSPATPSGYQLTAAWQSALGQANNASGFFAAILNGWLVPAYGQRRVVMWSLVLIIGGIFFPFFAPNLTVLTIGEVFLGFPWATLATCAISYAAEVLPPSIRTYLTSYTNMCFIIGQLIASGILKGLSNNTSQWAYRIPFALQWVWPCILLPLVYLAPESPWHLVRQNRLEEAEKALRRLQSSKCDIDPKHTLATIIHTNDFERRVHVEGSYWDCFRGPELRRTEIAALTYAGQVFVGIGFAYSSTYFFQSIGVGTSTTYSLGLSGNCLGLIGCFINWFAIMPYFGRRTIYICGLATLCPILLIIGILNVWTDHKGVALTQASLCLLWTFVFQLSIGQLGWSFPAEIGSSRLRQKTIGIARNLNTVTGLVAGILMQYLMNPEAWNVKGYVGFIWGGTSFLMLIWAYFRLPETWKRPYEELDIMFTQKVPARKFASTTVNAIEDNEVVLRSYEEAPRNMV